jgi:cytochrome c-type biogenesis protein CcmH
MRKWVAAVTLLAVLGLRPALAGLEEFDFSGNVDEDRYKALIAEIRCLVCQNQSLADSDAGLANDLRVEVYEHMQQGKDDAEIVDFLVARYGDFVLYNPPVKPSTYLLWYGPFVLLALGLWMLFRNVRQRDKQQETAFSEEEKARLKRLLEEDAGEERMP